ncbi:MFS transporter [Amycolatopsis orientalis]|uniref:MFS transporter n=1 Tax=Amycolatopsis orientalis TaxID=31958 RepID=UPI0003A33924|nr:MFS transporter [Amycolatopsis orientalis]
MTMTPQEFLDSAAMSARQRLVVGIVCLAMLAHGLDLASASFVYPELVRLEHASMGTVTLTVTAGVLALALAGAVAGPLADRFGRKGVAIVGITVFGLATAAMGLVPSIGAFVGFRLLACLGLGAMVPAVLTIVADTTPAARRASMVSLVWCGAAGGYIAGSFLASAVLPAWGWRALLVLCGLPPLLLVPVVAWLVPESASVLVARGHTPERIREVLARLSPGRDLSVVDLAPPVRGQRRWAGAEVLSRRFLNATLLIWFCSFVGLGVVFLIANYLPLLIDRNGYGTAQTGVLVGLFGICGLAGQLLVSAALRRFDARAVLAVLWLVGIAGVAVAGVVRLSPAAFLVVVLLLGLSLGGANAILPALAAITYPAAVRATGMSWANGVGQLGPVIGGLAGGMMIGAGWPTATIFLVLAVPVLAGIVATLVLLAGSRRQRVREAAAAELAAR